MQSVEQRKIVLDSIALGSATVPDGYFGETRKVAIGFHVPSGYVYLWDNDPVMPVCFRSGLPRCADAAEAAFWLNHPHHVMRNWRGTAITYCEDR